jgi:UDP-N-acetylmuramoylalanine--D-glutamate ligase
LKEVLVLGGGESGVGAALSAKHFNYEVFLSDAGLISQNYKTILNQAAIPFEENGHNIANQYNGDIVVKSPGIPDNALIIVSLKNK